MLQMRGQDENPEKDLKDMEINNLSDKEFKIMVIKVLTDFGRRIDGHSENVNKEKI